MQKTSESGGMQVVNKVSNTVRTLDLNITLRTGQTQYYLGNIRRLQDTLLQSILVPVNDALTKNINNTTVVSATSVYQAFLKLIDKKGDAIIDERWLGFYTPDTDYKPFQVFNNLDVDWEKSYIVYPDATQPNADNGKVLILSIGYCCQKDAQ
jgi:hypothetical protein